MKGLARFFYVVTHWETISEELKKRDERPQAIEEWGRQMLRLQREAHEAEREKLARVLREEAERWRTIANYGGEVAARATARIEDLQKETGALVEDHLAAVRGLAVMLYIEESAHIRERMLALVPPKVREMLTGTIDHFREIDQQGALETATETTPVTPPPLQ